jgi:hypothetical protein
MPVSFVGVLKAGVGVTGGDAALEFPKQPGVEDLRFDRLIECDCKSFGIAPHDFPHYAESSVEDEHRELEVDGLTLIDLAPSADEYPAGSDISD